MRILLSLLVLGSATSVVVAQEPRQRVEYSSGLFSGSGEGVVLAAAGSSCALSETTCESGCMPIGSVVSYFAFNHVVSSIGPQSWSSYGTSFPPPLSCHNRTSLTDDVVSQCCKDGTNTYCPINSVCNPGGCCPIGKTCKNGSGSASCAAGKTTCGIGCMPSSAECCSDGTYCPLGSKCSGSDYCCKIGKTCGSGSGGGSGGSGSGSGSSPTSSLLFDGGETTTSRRATHTSATENLPTATSDLSIPAAQTAGDDTPTTATGTSTPAKTPTAGPPTVTVTPTTVAGLPGGSSAGALDRADGKIAVGLAVAAALLI